MAPLPSKTAPDDTLIAIDAAIVSIENSKKKPIPHLASGLIGRKCERELWYGFRWVDQIASNVESCKCALDEANGKNIMADRIKMAGFKLHLTDPRNGKEFTVSAVGGHFRDSLDGAVVGLLQAPTTWHVWDHKTVNDTTKDKLEKLKAQVGEKQALKQWDPVYYGQAIMLMSLTGMTRHYLTISSPGERTTISCRTDNCPSEAKALLAKAKAVISATTPPFAMTSACEHCNFKDICFHGKLPQVNCRTCAHSTPELDSDARWSCNRYKQTIPLESSYKGCDQHVYLPMLLPWIQVNANEYENWIEYQGPSGNRFRNGIGYYSSDEIRVTYVDALGDPGIDALKKNSTPDWLLTENQRSKLKEPLSFAADVAISEEIILATVPA